VTKTQKYYNQEWFIVLVLFIIAAAIRIIPEIKAGVWPIGYDTFNSYVADLASYNGPLINWIKSANILYFLFLPFKIIGVHPLIIMKIFGPLLYGLLTISFYYFLRKFLNFSPLKAFIGGLLLIFQLGALRISWDLFRNELGLIFFFLALINLPKIKDNRNLIFFTLTSIIVVLSNQLVTVILGVVAGCNFLSLLKNKKFPEAWRLVIPGIIVALLFFMVINFPGKSLYDSHIIFTSESNYFGFYFYAYKQVMSYQQLASLIITLFLLLFSFVLPLVLYGFWLLRKNIILTALTLWLLAGTFSSLVFAGYGLIVWDRWLVMLVFPFVIYTLHGAFHLGNLIGGIKKWAAKTPLLAKALAAIFWLSFLGLFIWRDIPFLTASYVDAKPPLINDAINSYFPRTMVHNSVGIWKIQSTLNCVRWLNENAESGSAIIVDNRYRGLMMTEFNMDNRYIITNSWSETLQDSNLEMARERGLWPVYLIWNTSRSIDGFDRVFASGETGIYVALPESEKL